MTSGMLLWPPQSSFLQQASDETGHPYQQEPNEARLAVFAIALVNMEKAIDMARRRRMITPELREDVLLPDLINIVEAVERFRDERSVTINGGEQTLTHIKNLLDEAIDQLNSASELEEDITRPRDGEFLVDYRARYRKCADNLREAHRQIGKVGVDLLPYPPS